MLPIVIVVAALVFLYVLSGPGSVKLPAMNARRRREILDSRYEEAARSSRIQGVASKKVAYGPLSEVERQTFAATHERLEQLRKAA